MKNKIRKFFPFVFLLGVAGALYAAASFTFPGKLEVAQVNPTLYGVNVTSSGGVAPSYRWTHGGFLSQPQQIVLEGTLKLFVDLNGDGSKGVSDFYLDLPPGAQDLICVNCIGVNEIDIDDSAALRLLLSDENGTGASLFNGATSPNFLTDVTVGGTSVCQEDGTNCPAPGASFSDSAGLRAILSDENGTGAALFNGATSPNFTTDATVGGVSVCLEDGTNCNVTAERSVYVPLRPATCQNTVPLLNWDFETANTPAPTCVTGSNTQKAYADFDQTTDECLQTTLPLPSTWTGDVDVDYVWLTTATSGSVAWCMQVICVASTETDDPAFPAQASANCVSDAAHGTTNQINTASDTAITITGCAASEEMHLRLCRDPNETGGQTDTVAADARLADVMLKLRVSG